MGQLELLRKGSISNLQFRSSIKIFRLIATMQFTFKCIFKSLLSVTFAFAGEERAVVVDMRGVGKTSTSMKVSDDSDTNWIQIDSCGSGLQERGPSGVRGEGNPVCVGMCHYYRYMCHYYMHICALLSRI